MAATTAAIVVWGALTGAPAAQPAPTPSWSGPGPTTDAQTGSDRPAPGFESVPLPPPARTSYRAAYACLITGAGLITASFVLARHADQTYDRYLEAQEVSEIERLYDKTARYDRLSSGSLITGEVLVAAGIYLRFLRRPAPHLEVTFSPARCAACYRF